MITSGENLPGAPRSRPREREVEIGSATEGVRVTLSFPTDSGRVTNRRKVLERARRMLAAALEEERTREEREKAAAVQRTETQPGCGAWWLF